MTKVVRRDKIVNQLSSLFLLCSVFLSQSNQLGLGH